MSARRSLVLALALTTTLAAPALAETATPVQSPAPAAATTAGSPAKVLSFDNEAQVNGLAAKGQTVVFFYASWCPDCRATVTDLNAHWDNIHPGLTLVIADYDKDVALKAKYGVTYQDTFVLLDASGKGIKSWNGGGANGLNDNTKV